MPQLVIERAGEILEELEEANISKKEQRYKKARKPLDGQLDLITYKNISRSNDEVLNEIKNMDISKLTPLDALNILYNLQQKVRKE